MRRLLILLVFGLVLAGVVAVTWQAMGQAKLVEEDLTAARALLTRASGFESGKLSRRLRLVDQAQAHTLNAERRLGRWPLRQIGLVPLLGRDVRVASAVASSATGTARATREVVTALQPVQTGPRPGRRSSRPPAPCSACTRRSSRTSSGSAPPARWSPPARGSSTWRRPPRPAPPRGGPARG